MKTAHLTLVYVSAILALPGCNSEPKVAESVAPIPIKTEPPKPKIRFPKPEHVKGIYLTAWSAGSKSRLDKAIGLVKRTEINSIVIDIRDAGHVYVKTGIPLAKAAKAETVGILDPKGLMDKLEKRGVYPIARIACFRDKFVPVTNPELAVNKTTGGVWKDGGGYAWLDPYNRKNWDYIGEIVDFALDMGFPEIQLDYVRFPSEGRADTQLFPGKKGWPAETKPAQVVSEFAKFIGERVRAKNAVYSADIFGIISSSTSDQGIGQELESIAEPFDLICPMVYPSHFAKGEYGIKNPNASPYEVVLKSLRDYAKRLPNMKLRPWLQDFSLGVTYGEAEVRAQIKAAREVGYNEYLVWNGKNIYTEAAYKP